MRYRYLVPMLCLALLVRALAVDAAQSPEKCEMAKLKLTAKMAASLTLCYSKAAPGGAAPAVECLSKANESFAKAYAKLECLQVGELNSIQNTASVFSVDVEATVMPDAAASECGASKLKAIALATKKVVTAIGIDRVKPGKRAGTVSKAITKLKQTFAKAESTGADCQAVLHAYIVQRRIGQFADAIEGIVDGCGSVDPVTYEDMSFGLWRNTLLHAKSLGYTEISAAQVCPFSSDPSMSLTSSIATLRNPTLSGPLSMIDLIYGADHGAFLRKANGGAHLTLFGPDGGMQVLPVRDVVDSNGELEQQSLASSLAARAGTCDPDFCRGKWRDFKTCLAGLATGVEGCLECLFVRNKRACGACVIDAWAQDPCAPLATPDCQLCGTDTNCYLGANCSWGECVPHPRNETQQCDSPVLPVCASSSQIQDGACQKGYCLPGDPILCLSLDCRPGGGPGDAQCATCGDRTQNVGEVCDATAVNGDAQCPGACYPQGAPNECTCPVCGNEQLEIPGESCEVGVDDPREGCRDDQCQACKCHCAPMTGCSGEMTGTETNGDTDPMNDIPFDGDWTVTDIQSDEFVGGAWLHVVTSLGFMESFPSNTVVDCGIGAHGGFYAGNPGWSWYGNFVAGGCSSGTWVYGTSFGEWQGCCNYVPLP